MSKIDDYNQWDDYRNDVGEIRDAAKGILSNQERYSRDHDNGPDEVMVVNSHDDEIEDNTAEIVGNTAETNANIEAMSTELAFVRSGTDELPEIHGTLRNIQYATEAQVAAQLLGLTRQIYRWEEEDDQHAEIIDALDGINDGIAGLREGVLEGFADVTYELQGINDSIVQGFDDLDSGMEERNSLLIDTIQNVSVQVTRELQRYIGEIFIISESHQEARHQELVSTVQSSAKNRLASQTTEKYSDAVVQFKVGNLRRAIKDIRAALETKSTHIPSILLFGKIAARRTQWDIAKDAFYEASKLALALNDKESYQTAIIELSRIERIVGNKKQAVAVLRDGVTFTYIHQDRSTSERKTIFKGEFLERIEFENFRLGVQGYVNRVKQYGWSGKDRFIKKLEEILISNPEYCRAIRDDEAFKELRSLIPSIIYVPFIELAEIVNNPPMQKDGSPVNVMGGGRDIAYRESLQETYDKIKNIFATIDIEKIIKSPKLLSLMNKLQSKVIELHASNSAFIEYFFKIQKIIGLHNKEQARIHEINGLEAGINRQLEAKRKHYNDVVIQPEKKVDKLRKDLAAAKEMLPRIEQYDNSLRMLQEKESGLMATKSSLLAITVYADQKIAKEYLDRLPKIRALPEPYVLNGEAMAIFEIFPKMKFASKEAGEKWKNEYTQTVNALANVREELIRMRRQQPSKTIKSQTELINSYPELIVEAEKESASMADRSAIEVDIRRITDELAKLRSEKARISKTADEITRLFVMFEELKRNHNDEIILSLEELEKLLLESEK